MELYSLKQLINVDKVDKKLKNCQFCQHLCLNLLTNLKKRQNAVNKGIMRCSAGCLMQTKRNRKMFSDTMTENIMRNIPAKYPELSEACFFQYINTEHEDESDECRQICFCP